MTSPLTPEQEEAVVAYTREQIKKQRRDGIIRSLIGMCIGVGIVGVIALIWSLI